MPCLTDAELEQYLSDSASPDVRTAMEEHLRECGRCRERLEGLRADEELAGDLRRAFGDQTEDLDDGAPVLAAGEGADPGAKPSEGHLIVDSIPGYEITREIHRGGQGVVYQAIQKATKRKVAIKVMREGPFAGKRDKARFEREVRILGQLRHPNIVTVHDSGTTAGCFYYTMDYVSGRPLDDYVALSKPSINETLRLFAKICEAVNAAHLQGVIHRDLKPGNIRVDAEGKPHVLDFGLAKVAMAQTTDDSHPQAMTVTGQFMGSLPWASPEQAEAAPGKIDLRTDVYSLGVILYQMLTGQFPYQVVGNVRDVMDNILRTEPAKPSTIRRQINNEIETIVLKSLSKERERRYQTAGELGRDIERYLAGEPIEAKRDSGLYVLRKTLRRYRVPVGVGAAFVVLLAASLVVSVTLWAREAQERANAAAAQLLAERSKTETEKALQAERLAKEKAERLAESEEEARKKLNEALKDTKKERDRALAAEKHAGEERDKALAAERVAKSEQKRAEQLAADKEKALEQAVKSKGEAEEAKAEAEKQAHNAKEAEEKAVASAQEAEKQRDTAKQALVRAEDDRKRAEDARKKARTEADRASAVRSLLENAVLFAGQDVEANADRLLSALKLAEKRSAGLFRQQPYLEVATLNIAARAYAVAEKRDEAEKHAARALRLAHGSLGAEHPETIRAMVAQAHIMARKGRFVDRERLLSQAYEAARKGGLSEKNPERICAELAYAGLLSKQGRGREAEELERRCSESALAVFGPYHTAMLPGLTDWSSVLNVGPRETPLWYWRNAGNVYKELYGEDAEVFLLVRALACGIAYLGRLESLYDKKGKIAPPDEGLQAHVDEAAWTFHRSRRVHGWEHPLTPFAVLSYLGGLVSQGRYLDALGVLASVPADLTSRLKRGGDPLAPVPLVLLGAGVAAAGHGASKLGIQVPAARLRERGLRWCQEAIRLADETGPEGSRYAMQIACRELYCMVLEGIKDERLGAVNQEVIRLKEARDRDAIRVAEEHGSMPHVLRSRLSLSTVLGERGAYAEQEAELLSAWKLAKQELPAEEPTCREKLIRYYEKHGKYALAEGFRAP